MLSIGKLASLVQLHGSHAAQADTLLDGMFQALHTTSLF
jgi:hypothetical protein